MQGDGLPGQQPDVAGTAQRDDVIGLDAALKLQKRNGVAANGTGRAKNTDPATATPIVCHLI